MALLRQQLKAGIYARVSTDEQSLDMQLDELRAYATRQGWEIVEFVDKGVSGAKSKRPGLTECMEAARLKKIDLLLVWKLDRFGRSMKALIDNILLLDLYGVRFVSLLQGIDTDVRNPASRLLIHVLAAVAEFERSMIVDRVRSGMALAKRKGKHCGRPKAIWRRDQAEQLREQGLSWRAIARELDVPETTIRRGLREYAESAARRRVA